MAKRFTDTAKWKHPSFRQLPLKARMVWLYLLDECDHAGLWIADYDLASFQLGFNLTLEDLTSWFGDKLYFAGDKRIFIPDFVRFQYSVRKNDDILSTNKALLGVLREFESHGVSLDFPGIPLSRGYEGATEGLPSPTRIGIGVGTGIGKGGLGEKPKPSDLESLYQKYPRKEGKAKGMIICKAQIKSPEDLAALSLAIDRYSEHIKRTATDPKYIKHFSTFMAHWRDWLEPETGSVAQPKQEEPEWMKREREREAKSAV